MIGFVYGVLFSVLPGPGGYAVLKPSMGGNRTRAFKQLLGLLAGDLVVLMICALFLHSLSAQAWFTDGLRLGGGIFFVAYAFLQWNKVGHVAKEGRRGDAFQLTIFNPNTWVGMIFILSLAGTQNLLSFIVFLELGVLAWFVFAILGLRHLKFAHQVWFQRVILSLIVVIGFMLMARVLVPRVHADEIFECREVGSINHSKRMDCRVSTERGDKTFHVLRLQGSFTQSAFDHGYLLAKESQTGLLREIINRIQSGLRKGSLAEREIKRAVFNCYANRIKSSLSKEFLNASDEFYRGFLKRLREDGVRVSYHKEDILMAAIGVELSISTEGLARRIEQSPILAYADLVKTCGVSFGVSSLKHLLELIEDIGGGLKMGCIGFVAPGHTTKDGDLLHARNLDANLVESWNTAPTLFLIDEPGYARFAATATAGMVFPGGISGFNEYGISVSLHEMSTDRYRTKFYNNEGKIAPFLQQTILRSARSLDEAILIARASGHFGAWTILVSDAETNEVASIEFSGERLQVARRYQNKPMGQSNHFLGSRMQDQAFSYSFNKVLESASRLQVIMKAMNQEAGNIDYRWAIDHLSGHEDAFEGFRSFGRTATKAYTVMSTIAIPARNEFWVSLGERRPASHSTFLGFKIDFDTLRATPIGKHRTTQYERILNWEQSLELYSDARLAFLHSQPQRAIEKLTEAIALASKDGLIELPYYFMRARVKHHIGMYKQAAVDWHYLWTSRHKVHPYHRGLIALYKAVTTNQIEKAEKEEPFFPVFYRNKKWEKERKALLTYARAQFVRMNQTYDHFDLDLKIEQVKKATKLTFNDLSELDFVTVE